MTKKAMKLKELYSVKRSLKMNPNETAGSEDEEARSEKETCPTCGMAQQNWSSKHGFEQGGEAYCCRGCAEGRGCVCSEETVKSHSQKR